MLPLSMICDVNMRSRHENMLFCITVLHYERCLIVYVVEG